MPQRLIGGAKTILSEPIKTAEKLEEQIVKLHISCVNNNHADSTRFKNMTKVERHIRIVVDFPFHKTDDVLLTLKKECNCEEQGLTIHKLQIATFRDKYIYIYLPLKFFFTKFSFSGCYA